MASKTFSMIQFQDNLVASLNTMRANRVRTGKLLLGRARKQLKRLGYHWSQAEQIVDDAVDMADLLWEANGLVRKPLS